jgi:hypothetical protein
MTIVELNIAGLHVTGSATAFRRSWGRSLQRNCRALKRKSAQLRPVGMRPRPASEDSAA